MPISSIDLWEIEGIYSVAGNPFDIEESALLEKEWSMNVFSGHKQDNTKELFFLLNGVLRKINIGHSTNSEIPEIDEGFIETGVGVGYIDETLFLLKENDGLLPIREGQLMDKVKKVKIPIDPSGYFVISGNYAYAVSEPYREGSEFQRDPRCAKVDIFKFSNNFQSVNFVRSFSLKDIYPANECLLSVSNNNKYLFIEAGSINAGIIAYDISNPESPKHQFTLREETYSGGILGHNMQEEYFFMLTYPVRNGIRVTSIEIYDISNNKKPRLVYEDDSIKIAFGKMLDYGFFVEGNKMYFLNGDTLDVYNISNLPDVGEPVRHYISNDNFVAVGDYGFHHKNNILITYDLSDYKNLEKVSELTIKGMSEIDRFSLLNPSYGIVAEEGGERFLVDISNPQDLNIIKSLSRRYGSKSSLINNLFIERNSYSDSDKMFLQIFPYSTEGASMQTVKLNKEDENIKEATMIDINTHMPQETSISYFLSNDGGENWKQTGLGKKCVFDTVGGDLRFKLVLKTENLYYSPIISGIKVNYKK